MPEVFFLLFAAKIEQGSRDRDERFFFPARHDSGFAAQFSPQTTGKKTSGTQGTIKPPRWRIYFKHVWGGGVLIERGGLFSLAKQDAILPFKRSGDDINSPYKELKGNEV